MNTHYPGRIIATSDQIVELILKYARRQPMTHEESDLLENWRAKSEYCRQLPDLFRDPKWVMQQLKEREQVPSNDIWNLLCDRYEGLDRNASP